MSLHDAYARVTPFEVAFPDRGRVDALVESVSAEAAERGADATVPDDFLALACVGAFLAEVHGMDVPRVELLEHGTLAFHAVHFTAVGCPVYLLTTAATRHIVEDVPVSEPTPLGRAGYVQLPQHLFWTRPGDAQAPESLDGMFWTLSRDGVLHVLSIAGLRPGRPGFAAFALPPAPLTHAERWLRANMRERGADYASTLPGAYVDRLYGIETAGELLKLLARLFAYTAASPEALERSCPPEGASGGPQPSALPYTRVQLLA